MDAGILAFAAARMVRLPKDLFLIPDAPGLALFTVLGIQIALDLNIHWFVATLMGVVTGVFGGIVREMLCNEVPLVFIGELYATAAWSGALLLVLLLHLGVHGPVATIAAMATILQARLAGIYWHITLPKFSSK